VAAPRTIQRVAPLRCDTFEPELAGVDPEVDAVDWVERIPLAETRNYVQRVMENLQVYQERFGDVIATVEPNLHRAATIEWRPKPAAVEQRPLTIDVDLSSRN